MGTYLREQAIEAIARNVLKAYDYALLRPNSGAVPILDIAIKLLKLEVEYQYIRNNGRILGETVFRDTMVPLYNEDEKQYELVFMPAGTVILDGSLLSKGCEGRLRYTLAHEIGHWVLHQPVYSSMTISTAAMSAEKARRTIRRWSVRRICWRRRYSCLSVHSRALSMPFVLDMQRKSSLRSLPARFKYPNRRWPYACAAIG